MPKIMKNGVAYGSSPAKLNELSDVTTTSPQANQLLARNSANNGWVNKNVNGTNLINNPSASATQTIAQKINAVQNSIPDMSKTNFTSQVTFNEDYANARFFAMAGVVYITYQGEAKTHARDDVLFNIPESYRPNHTVFIPFMVNAGAYGVLFIYSDGRALINQLSDATFSGRVYFSTAYTLP